MRYQSLVAVLQRTRNSLRIRTYKPPLPHLSAGAALQRRWNPFAFITYKSFHQRIHSKSLTSPAESTLTQPPPPNSFILRTSKKPGGGSLWHKQVPQISSRSWFCLSLAKHHWPAPSPTTSSETRAGLGSLSTFNWHTPTGSRRLSTPLPTTLTINEGCACPSVSLRHPMTCAKVALDT
jgi:hypothetical protein